MPTTKPSPLPLTAEMAAAWAYKLEPCDKPEGF